MKFQTNRKWLFFLFITLLSLWFSGYVQREIHVFHDRIAIDFFDFKVYYTAGLVARSDTDKRLYSYQEVQDPNDASQKIVVNPQLQPPDPDSTYGYFAKQTGSSGQYLYPPFFSMPMIPLTYLSIEKAKILWHVFIFLLACVSVVVTVKLFYEDYLTVALISGVAILAMEFTHPMQNLRVLGNVSSIIAFLMASGLYLHKKYPHIGALFFALAVIIKLTPLVVVPLMLIRKQWKWLIAFCCWSVLLLGISVWQLGWQNHWEFFAHVMPAMSDGVPISPNRSFSTTFYALGSGKFLSTGEILQGAYLFPSKYPILLFKLVAVASFCGLLGFFWYNNKTTLQICVEVLLVMLWSIIFSPVSFRHYYLLALPPVVFAWIHPLTKKASTFWLALLSAATFMIFSVLSSYVYAVTDSFPVQLLVFLIMPAGVVLCIIYFMMLLKSKAGIISDC
jgi:hypothetical protein